MDLSLIKNKVYHNSLETCEYVDGFVDTKSTITVRCLKHDLQFMTKYENVRRDNRAHHICPECKKEDIQEKNADNRELVKCAYCNQDFYIRASRAGLSKSGLNFCCREHKDLAQRLSSGEKFAAMRPTMYGNGERMYRDIAFRSLPHRCDCCGWDEDERILEVHHIDSNRDNNVLDNLAILCPTCHRKITLHYYAYDKENHKLIKNQ